MIDCIFTQGVRLVSCAGSNYDEVCHGIPLLHFLGSCELVRLCMHTKNEFYKGMSFIYSIVDIMISILLFISPCKIEHLLFFFSLGLWRVPDLNVIEKG